MSSDSEIIKTPSRFLVIDDNEMDQEILIRLLKKIFNGNKNSFATAFDDQEAISLIKKNTYDCIFLDYNLPAATAVDVLTPVRIFIPNTPIIVITGRNDDQTILNIMKAGATDYICKSELNQHSLNKVIHNALDSSNLKISNQESQTKALHNSKMAALGILAGGVSHEINNPLSIILGQTERYYLLKERGRLTEESTDKIFTSIAEMSKRILGIVRGLQIFTQGLREDTLNNVTIPTILELAKKYARTSLKSKAINLEIVNSLKLTIKCNENQIAQIILNLVNNAADAIFEKKDKWIKIITRDAGENIEISVIDCGTGIEEGVVENIFTPFFTTKDIGSGTGLGLSISKGVLNKVGGNLHYDRKSVNTTFVITLPKLVTDEVKKAS